VLSEQFFQNHTSWCRIRFPLFSPLSCECKELLSANPSWNALVGVWMGRELSCWCWPESSWCLL